MAAQLSNRFTFSSICLFLRHSFVHVMATLALMCVLLCSSTISNEHLVFVQEHQKLLSKEARNSYGHPSEYSYLKGEDFFVQFTMKKEDRATVILQFEEALAMKHKFVLRLINDNWLIDEKYYGFSDEETWYSDML